MTFSAGVKAELCRAPIDRERAAVAEVCGMLLFANQFSNRGLRITTENADFAHRASRLLKSLFGFDFDRKIIPGGAVRKYSLSIENREKLAAIFDAFGFELASTHTIHLNSALVEDDATRAAFLRGAFLSGGSAIDPEREYHLELVTSHYYLAREVLALLYELEITARLTQRKGNHIVYFKESGGIEELLTRIGAPLAAMRVMETKMYKELRNSINRKVNCETANLTKTVDAAAAQLRAIERIEQTTGLDSLSEPLRAAALARRTYPAATLSELCEALGGTVTKSGLNHRLRKLLALGGE